MTETIGGGDHAVAVITDTAPAALRTTDTAAAARTAPESTDKGHADNPEVGPGPALGLRVPDQTLRLHPILKRSRGTDTRGHSHGLPPGPAHDPAPGPAVNLEVVRGNCWWSFLNMNVMSH